MISISSESTYLNTIVSFIIFLYTSATSAPDASMDEELEEVPLNEEPARIARGRVLQLIQTQNQCPLSQTGLNFMEAIQEQSIPSTKRKVKEALKLTPPLAFFQFEILSEIHFVRYVLSLKKSNGAK